MRDAFDARGWCRFPYDETLARWVEQVLPVARAVVAAPAKPAWRRCGGTWFVGINALPNDARGAVPGSAAIAGKAIDFIRGDLGMTEFGWDRGQISVVYPGYPRQEQNESDAAFRFRRERAAAHVDGILHEGPARRRHLRQYHDFILGIPMVAAGPGMSPLVLWEGSHEIVRAGFRDRYAGKPSPAWPDEDVTERYRAVRRQIFETCERVEIVAQPGEAYLLHRLTLHGIAPWTATDSDAAPDGRMVVYFRPDTGTPERWLNSP